MDLRNEPAERRNLFIRGFGSETELQVEFYCCYYNAITFRVISKFWWGKCGANVKNKIAQALIFNYLGNLPCDSVGIRTQDLLLRRQLLYPAELRNHFKGQ